MDYFNATGIYNYSDENWSGEFGSLTSYSLPKNNKPQQKPEPDPDKYTEEEMEAIRKESIHGNNRWARAFAEVDKKKDREAKEKPLPENILSITPEGEITIDILSTDPVLSRRRLYDRRTIILNSNRITPLVGCNGAGKTTMITCLKEAITKANFPVIDFNNLLDGGGNAIEAAAYGNDLSLTASLMCSSEGEGIYQNVIPYLQLVNTVISGKYKRNEYLQLYRDTDHIFLFMDAIDSGFSLDNIASLKVNLSDLIENSIKVNKHLYIIAAANSFELARNCICWDVQHSKYIEFGTDYEKYREFIIKSRQRIIKQWDNIDKKSKGDNENGTSTSEEK